MSLTILLFKVTRKDIPLYIESVVERKVFRLDSKIRKLEMHKNRGHKSVLFMSKSDIASCTRAFCIKRKHKNSLDANSFICTKIWISKGNCQKNNKDGSLYQRSSPKTLFCVGNAITKCCHVNWYSTKHEFMQIYLVFCFLYTYNAFL